jgi:hypothetical protein
MDTAATIQAPAAPADIPPARRGRMRLYVADLDNRRPSPWELYSLILIIGAAIYIPLSYVMWTPPVESPLRYLGYACPLCGGTRAVTALCTGQFMLAIKYNPFAIVLLGFLVWGVLSFVFLVLPFKKRVVLEATRRQTSMFWIAVACIMIANWGYVLWAGMYKVPLKL